MQYYCNTYMNPECGTRDGHDKSHTLKKLNTLDHQFQFETVIYNEIHRLIRYNAILWFRHLRHFSNMAWTPKLTNWENHSEGFYEAFWKFAEVDSPRMRKNSNAGRPRSHSLSVTLKLQVEKPHTQAGWGSAGVQVVAGVALSRVTLSSSVGLTGLAVCTTS